jgi:hypothetical protein
MEFLISLLISFYLAWYSFGANDIPTFRPPAPTATPEVISDEDFFEKEKEIKKTPKPSLSPTSTPSSAISISEFQYPGATVISSSATSLVLRSGDDPQKISNWYQEKIEARKMSAVSFISNNVNNSISNKLVGEEDGQRISVDITRESGASETEIEVKISS